MIRTQDFIAVQIEEYFVCLHQISLRTRSDVVRSSFCTFLFGKQGC
jgi:hypothetical protein